MRVALINVTSNLSTGRIATDLCRVCLNAGHEALLCYSRGPKPEDIYSYCLGDSLKLLRLSGIHKVTRKIRFKLNHMRNLTNTNLHVLTTRMFDRPGFFKTPFLLRQTAKLIEFLKQFHPDVVHLHNIHGYYLYLPMLFDYLKQNKIPVVWTLHDCWSYTGHCAYYTMVQNSLPPDGLLPGQLPEDASGCQRWRTGCGHCPQLHSYPASWIRDRSKKNWQEKKKFFTELNYLIPVTPSRWLRNEAVQSFWAPLANRFQVIPSGIDLNQFHPCLKNDFLIQKLEKSGLQNIKNRYMILSVAAVWDERKGLRDLIELSKILGNHYAVVCVGLDEAQAEAVPENTVIPLSRTENIESLCALYTAANVYVSASYEETQGMTLLESLACGTQVICYHATALPEIVTSSVGLTVPKGDIDVLARAVRQLCHEPKKPEDCLALAQQYESGKCFSRYIRLYEDMVSAIQH